MADFFYLDVGVALGAGGLLVGVVGAVLSWKAWSAADDAKLAADRAIAAIADRVTLTDLAEMRYLVSEIQTAMDSQQAAVGMIRSVDLRHALIGLRTRREFTDNKQNLKVIQTNVIFFEGITDVTERRAAIWQAA